MPYQYILANLLAEADEAVGVLFVDEEGETVDLAGTTPSAEVDLRVTGAYVGIYVQRVVSLAQERQLGRPRIVYVERQGLTILACALSAGYSLALIQRSPQAVGSTSRSLLRAAADLEREVLHEISQ